MFRGVCYSNHTNKTQIPVWLAYTYIQQIGDPYGANGIRRYWTFITMKCYKLNNISLHFLCAFLVESISTAIRPVV